MTEVTCIFPHQLFENHPALAKERPIFLIEEFLLFSIQRFHKMRLTLLRASMKEYEIFLKKKGYTTGYIDHTHCEKRGDWIKVLAQKGVTHLHFAEAADDFLMQDIRNAPLEFTVYDSPMFLLSLDEIEEIFHNEANWKMGSFYIKQRKTHHILIENGKPVGGKWSFDAENRKRLPQNCRLPSLPTSNSSSCIQEAQRYVDTHFPSAYGSHSPFLYPTTFALAEKWLDNFLNERFAFFGPYEDAIAKDESFLFHSVLSPLLNVGLLTPRQVLKKALDFAKKHKTPLASLEGFVRQIIGWREFMRATYQLKGRSQRNRSFFHHKKALPSSFWDGTTGIPPVDETIKKVLKTGYAHHIERLMVLGNFMFLCEFSPTSIYEWFMALFVDAYDWVMVPNVYGMSQFADGGTIVTKPYFSGSNYLLKMSNYAKGDWCAVWDGLFWRFMKKHRSFLETNQRMSVLTKQLDKKNPEREQKIKAAERFLASHTQ